MRKIVPQWTPELLMEKLKETVIGQDEYLKDLCTAVWLHSVRKELYEATETFYSQPKLNMLVLGKSGTGKTSTIQALANILDVSVVIEDASLFTGAGWKGREVASIVRDIMTSTGDSTDAEFAIVVLDEIDKVFVNNADNPTFPATNNFLKFIEGTEIKYEENHQVYCMNTRNLLFICLGAFDGLEEIITRRMQKGKNIGIGFCTEHNTEIPENIFRHAEKEDLIEYGINHQFLGRISMITATNELDAQDLQQIILKSSTSPVRQIDTLLNASMGAHAAITETAAKYIAEKTAGKGTGARALMSELTEAYKPGLYSIAAKDDIRELRLDYAPGTQQLSLQYIKGCRDTAAIYQRKLPESEFEPDSLKSIPILLNQYNLATVTQYAETIAERTILDGSRSISKYTYRQIKAATYILAACVLSIVLSDEPYTLYSVWMALQQLFQSPVADSLKSFGHKEPSELYYKALDFDLGIRQSVNLGFMMLKDYYTILQEELDDFCTEV